MEDVTKFVEYMIFFNRNNMPVVKGKKHTYIIMDLEYNFPGEVIVSMYNYNTEAID